MNNFVEPSDSNRIPVEILGATGSVGQKLVARLQNHPWFSIQALRASDRSAGQKYRDATPWHFPTELKSDVANMDVMRCVPDGNAPIAFSGLDAAVAGEIETDFAQAGYYVVSNAKNHRMEHDVPLLIPEVNSEHLDIIRHQRFEAGRIITNPNCSTIGIALALKPLHDAFGVRTVDVTTLQAAWGAGYPGHPAVDLIDNVMPDIPGEREKIRIELKKILGSYDGQVIIPAPFSVDAQCTRVPVSYGHTACVKVGLETRVSLRKVRKAMQQFRSPIADLHLPTAPEKPIHFLENPKHPQPRLHRDQEGGMAISVGQLQESETLDCMFIATFDNLERGAAGAAILNAELLVRRNMLSALG